MGSIKFELKFYTINSLNVFIIIIIIIIVSNDSSTKHVQCFPLFNIDDSSLLSFIYKKLIRNTLKSLNISHNKEHCSF